MQGKPVVPPPAKHATNRPQGKYAEQAVKRAQLDWLEFERIAARALTPYP
jgi:hypothetical protein